MTELIIFIWACALVSCLTLLLGFRIGINASKDVDKSLIDNIKADTVREMQERITVHATNGYPRKVRLDVIDQIAKEMVEGEK